MRVYIRSINCCDDCPEVCRDAAGYTCAALNYEPLGNPFNLHHACPLPEVVDKSPCMLDDAEQVVELSTADYEVIEV